MVDFLVYQYKIDSAKEDKQSVEFNEEFQIIIEQIDIPQTEQFDQPPPPARPSVPVESESEDIAEVFMSYLEENGTSVSKLMDISKANELEYHFSNWM